MDPKKGKGKGDDGDERIRDLNRIRISWKGIQEKEEKIKGEKKGKCRSRGVEIGRAHV